VYILCINYLVEDIILDMSPEQLKAYERLTELQRGMVKYLHEGYPPKEAYKLAGGKAKNDASLSTCVSGLLRDANVTNFRRLMHIEDLNAMTMSRAEMLRRLTELGRGRIANIAKVVKRVVGYTDEADEIWETVVEVQDFDDVDEAELGAISELSQKEHGITIKMHSPLQAMKQLAELQGLEAPKRTEISGPGGGAIKITSVDPVEAARQYQEIMQQG
jgi:phage terminase small subunit